MLFEQTFNEQILKLKRQSEVNIEYYILPDKGREHHYSFIGYLTNGGRHGIHYNRTKNTHYFGHQNPKTGSRPIALHPGLLMKIPPRIKDGLLSVANNRSGTVVKKT